MILLCLACGSHRVTVRRRALTCRDCETCYWLPVWQLIQL